MLRFIILFLLMASIAFAQTRPGTDVGTGEAIYVSALMEDNSVVLYTIYDSTTGAIRAYSLWNDSVGPVSVRLEFVTGDPIELTAQPGSRAGARVFERGYTMTGEIDENIVRFQGWVEHPIASKDRDRTFPISRTER